MNERDLFMAALQIEDAAKRATYLDQACAGETALRQRVEALLAAFDQAGSFLQQPAGDPRATSDVSHPGTASGSDPAAGPGTVIGPYKLIEQIGEGGMGTVWMAQQTEPVKRLVAVKLIKAGMDTRQVIARFEAERQALALMDHPNIARVLDAGTTSAGLPYFVMDLVKGVPITKYCDEHRLTPRQRLELFLPVCQAVQHAHQKGIIHRDLKPSNVLVAHYDGKPVPKVIDFGVAKAAGQPLTEKTLVTGFGNIVGTLEYMSPEQAEVNQLDIDTRSDIYSLGVLLYELLTGSTPFTKKGLERAGMLEMLRVIREQEPSKPSTKLRTADGLPTLAANRGTEPAKLTNLVRGELDWIVMKALEKDRNHRYETASGFALDVQRYLADEPVQACPPSVTYRLRKLVRRHKAAVVTTAMVVVAFLVTAGAVGWAVRDREASAEKIARDRETRLDAISEQARESVSRARRLIAADKLPSARQEIAEAKGRIGNDRNALRGVAEEIEALEIALERFAGFLNLIDKAHEAEISPTVEMAYEAPPSSGVDRDPAKAVAFLLQALSQYEVLDRDDWLATLEMGILDRSQVSRVRRNVYDELLWLADDVVQRKQDHRSERALQSAEAAHLALAYLRKAEDAFGPTAAWFAIRGACRRALADETAAHEDAKLAGQMPAVIALDYYLRGNVHYGARNKAEAAKEFLAALRVEPTHYWSLMRLGGCLTDLGEGEQDFVAAVTAFNGCMLKRPDHAHAYFCRGNANKKLRRYQDALADFSKAIELDPKHTGAWANRGRTYGRLRQPDKALADLSTAVALNPQDALAWYSRGRAHFELKQLEEALADYSKSTELNPKLASAWTDRGNIDLHLKQPDKAVSDCSRAIELDPKVALAWSNRGAAYAELGELDKAISDCSRAIELDPKLALAWTNRGATLLRRGHRVKALADCSKAVELDPKQSNAWSNRGAVFAELGQLDKALADCSKAIEMDPQDATAWHNRGTVYSRLFQRDKAIADFSKVIELNPQNANAWVFRGQEHDALRQSDKALADLSKAIELDARNAIAWYERARVHGRLGQYKKAIADFSMVVELNPKDANAHTGLSNNYMRLGQWDQTILHASKALELDANKWGVRENRGWACQQLGRWTEAIDDYTEVLKHAPDDRDAFFNNYAWLLATCPKRELRDLPLALKLATKAVNRSPKHWYYLSTLGVVYYRAGEWKAALSALEKARELSPGEPHAGIMYFLAMTEWQLGHQDEARKWHRQANQWTDKNQPNDEELCRFRAEAAELLSVNEKKN